MRRDRPEIAPAVESALVKLAPHLAAHDHLQTGKIGSELICSHEHLCGRACGARATQRRLRGRETLDDHEPARSERSDARRVEARARGGR